MTEFATLGNEVFADWDDGDGELIDLELRTALWDAWDLDGDDAIDHYEYHRD